MILKIVLAEQWAVQAKLRIFQHATVNRPIG
jgi:hypothetical protein